MNIQSILDRIIATRHALNELEIEVRNLVKPAEQQTPELVLLDQLMTATATIFKIAPAAILSDNRSMLLVSARTAFVRAARNAHLGWTTIANYLEKDHSSIIYLDNQYDDRLRKLPEHAGLMQAVTNQFAKAA